MVKKYAEVRQVEELLIDGKFHAAMQAAADAIERGRTPGHTSAVPLEISLDLLARFHVCQRRYDSALPLHQEALSIAEERFGNSSEECAWFTSRLSCDFLNLGRVDEAALCCSKEIAILDQLGGQTHQHYARALSNLAAVESRRGSVAAAERLQIRSLRLRLEQFGRRSFTAAWGLSDLSGTYRRAGRWRAGTKALEQAVSVYEREVWRAEVLHWRFCAEDLRDLGICHGHLGNVAAARGRLGQALRLFSEFLDAGHADIADVRDRLRRIDRCVVA